MVAVDRHHGKPATLQIGGTTRQRRDVAGIGLATVSRRHHDQPTPGIDEGGIGVVEALRRGRGGIGPVQAAPRVVRDLDVVGDQVVIDRAQRVGAGDQVALPGAIVGRLDVTDDACRHQLRARRDATGEKAERLARGNFRHPGAMADHVIDGGVVERRVNIDQLLCHPAGQRRMVAHDAAVDDADGDPVAIETLRMRGPGIRDAELGIDRWIRGGPGSGSGCRRGGWGWRRSGRRRRCRRGFHVADATATTASTTACAQGQRHANHQRRLAATHVLSDSFHVVSPLESRNGAWPPNFVSYGAELEY